MWGGAHFHGCKGPFYWQILHWQHILDNSALEVISVTVVLAGSKKGKVNNVAVAGCEKLDECPLHKNTNVSMTVGFTTSELGIVDVVG